MNNNTIIIIAICIGMFFLLREVVCWYFKINQRVKLQIESNAQQKEIINLLKEKSATTDVATDFAIDADGVKRYK